MAKTPEKAKPKGKAKKKEKDPLLVAFGEQLRQLRLEADLSQEELAEYAGLHWTYVGQIERGERNLTLLNVLKLARGLDMTASDLLDGI